MTAPLGKKKIKKRPGSTNAYFTQVTQESIQFFQINEVSRARDAAFENEILPAFKKMAEYWVHAYGTESSPQTKEELIQGCVGFLHDCIHKWDPERATKAFSYFNVIARNWLINAVNNNKKSGFRDLSIDNIDLNSVIREKDVNDKLITCSVESDIIEMENIQEIRQRVKKIRMALDDEKDLIVIESIEKIFDSAEHLDFMNRSALFIYIREISGLDKKTISRSMSKIRKVYKQIREIERKE